MNRWSPLVGSLLVAMTAACAETGGASAAAGGGDAGADSGSSGVDATNDVAAEASGEVEHTGQQPLVEVESYPCTHGGGGGGGGGAGPLSPDAMTDIQFLLANHASVTRVVDFREDGVETWTTSADPEVAAALNRHVAAMYQRVYVDQGGVRGWDPLFAAITAAHDGQTLDVEPLDNGVHVFHLGSTDDLIRMVHAHAQVVSRFVEGGQAEAEQCHQIAEP